MKGLTPIRSKMSIFREKFKVGDIIIRYYPYNTFEWKIVGFEKDTVLIKTYPCDNDDLNQAASWNINEEHVNIDRIRKINEK